MKKTEVFELLRDRNWNFFSNNDNNFVLVAINGQHSDWSFIMIKFEKDGTISFPVDLSFYPPEMRFWDFDEEANQIIIYNAEHQEFVRSSIPEVGFHGEQLLKLTNGNLYTTSPHVNVQELRDYTLGGQKTLFFNRANISFGMFHDLNENEGYNITPIDLDGNVVSALKQVQKYLSEHDKLQQVIISLNDDMSVVNVKANRMFVEFNGNNPKRMNRLAGERSLVLEFLNEVLIEDNKRILLEQDESVIDEMINRVLQETFKDRYDTE